MQIKTMTLLEKIELEISMLKERDVAGYIWWNKFKEMVEQHNNELAPKVKQLKRDVEYLLKNKQ